MPEQMALGSADPSWMGEYRLIGRLGEGGQGVVYLATAPSGARVVVKLLRMEGLADPAARSRLAREVNAARTVARFCTAQVIEARLEGEQPFIVSEYVEGPTLAEHVRTRGPLSGSALDRLAIGTATALAAIHQARIVHRDFKPGNVILGPDGARVIDFGIAHDLVGDATATAPLLGTPAFTAPEQINASAVGPAADMFAWASTMAFAATGYSPFHGATPVAQLHQVLTVDPDLSGVPQPLGAVLARCLAKNPAHRPTAEQVLLHLLGGVRADASSTGSADALARASAYARSVPTGAGGEWAVPGGAARGASPSGPFTPITPFPPIMPASPRRDSGAARYVSSGPPISPSSATLVSDPPARRPVATPDAFTEQLSPPPRSRDRDRFWDRDDVRNDYADGPDYRADGPDYRADFEVGFTDEDDQPRGRRFGRMPMVLTALVLVLVVGFGARWAMTAKQRGGNARPATGSGPASPAIGGGNTAMTQDQLANPGGQAAGGPPQGQGDIPAGQAMGGGQLTVPAGFVGTWTGQVEQPPGSGRTFPATLSLTGAAAGTFSLPTLGCAARLRAAGEVPDPQRLTVSARTTADPLGRCARAAMITMTLAEGGGLNIFWQDITNPANTAVATLARN